MIDIDNLNGTVVSANNILIIFAIIGSVGIIGGWIAKKIRIPDVVAYLCAGIFIGPVFLHIINLEEHPIVNELILTFGSAFILYEGGREIKLKVLNRVKVTVMLLSTWGVLISTVIIGYASFLILDIPLIYGLLLGSIIASTDPASLIPVFSVIPINNRLKQTVISESAFNDAAGAILFTSLLGIITVGKFNLPDIIIDLVLMVVIGTLVGVGTALIATGLTSERFYGIFSNFTPIISILSVIFSFELANNFHGSGYMAVFVAGLVSGNKEVFGLRIPEMYYISSQHFSENIVIICKMSIFISLGTQIDLKTLINYGLPSILIVLILMFIARPIVVLTSSLPDKRASWKFNEIIFMMWVRETGVIPAALLGMVVSLKIPNYEVISSTVFATILITLIIQASSTALVAKKLNVLTNEDES